MSEESFRAGFLLGFLGQGRCAGPWGHSVLSRQDLGCWEWKILQFSEPCSLAELSLCSSKAPDPSLNQQQQNSCQKKLPVGSPSQENPNSQEEFSEYSQRRLLLRSVTRHTVQLKMFPCSSVFPVTGKRQENNRTLPGIPNPSPATSPPTQNIETAQKATNKALQLHLNSNRPGISQ